MGVAQYLEARITLELYSGLKKNTFFLLICLIVSTGNSIWFEYLLKFEFIFDTSLGYGSRDQADVFDEKPSGVNISHYCSFNWFTALHVGNLWSENIFKIMNTIEGIFFTLFLEWSHATCWHPKQNGFQKHSYKVREKLNKSMYWKIQN